MKHRGVTWVTFLVVIGGLAGVFWIVTYGPAYWDNIDVNRALKAAANMCYREQDDNKVRRFVLVELQRKFGTEERDQNGEPMLSIDFGPDDLRIERQENPRWVNIWLTYRRTVKMPFVDQERELVFYDHADQDLSPVKW